MILNQKSAKRLNRPMTIDLRRIILEDEGYIYSPKKQYDVIFTYFFLLGVIFFIFAMFYAFWGLIPTTQAYNENNYTIDSIIVPLPRFLYDNVKIECQGAKNKHHCIKTALSIAYAESTWGIPTNYFGIQAKDNDIHGFVTRYNKFWYKAKEGSFFYGSNGKPGKSRYCLSEDSSGTIGSCPNGEINFNFIFLNKNLDKFIKKGLN